jgi:hypothetical protein
MDAKQRDGVWFAATDFERGPTTWAWAMSAVVTFVVAALVQRRFDLDSIAMVVFAMFAVAAPNMHVKERQPRRVLVAIGFFAAWLVLVGRLLT